MNTSSVVSAGPPMPSDPAEQERWTHSRLRRRLLYGQHKQDVWNLVVESVGAERAQAWKPLDMSSNPFAFAWEQLAALYDDEPEVVGPNQVVADAVADAGWWAQARRVQRDTLGLRDLAVLVEVEDGAPSFRMIYPDLLQVAAHPRRPNQPTQALWWECIGGDWLRYELDPSQRVYRVTTPKGLDVSGDILGGNFSGSAYPFVADGQPIMPLVMYHAAMTGWTWDAYARRELVDGSLNLALFYTHYGHVLRNAAWQQRYAAGVRPSSSSVQDGEDGNPSAHVVADPATVLMLEADGETQPLIGQWASPVDPRSMLTSIQSYERRLIEQAVGGSQVTRETSDVRSGYSLAVARESVIRQQSVSAPVFRPSDRRLLQVVSGLMGYPMEWPTRLANRRRDIEYMLERPEEVDDGKQPPKKDTQDGKRPGESDA